MGGGAGLHHNKGGRREKGHVRYKKSLALPSIIHVKNSVKTRLKKKQRWNTPRQPKSYQTEKLETRETAYSAGQLIQRLEKGSGAPKISFPVGTVHGLN